MRWADSILNASLLLVSNVFAYALYSSSTLKPYLPVRTASSTFAEKELTNGIVPKEARNIRHPRPSRMVPGNKRLNLSIHQNERRLGQPIIVPNTCLRMPPQCILIEKNQIFTLTSTEAGVPRRGQSLIPLPHTLHRRVAFHYLLEVLSGSRRRRLQFECLGASLPIRFPEASG